MDLTGQPVDAFSAIATLEDPADNTSFQLKIDEVFRVANRVFIMGWTTIPELECAVLCGKADDEDAPQTISPNVMKVSRADVAEAYNMPSDQIGFVLHFDEEDAAEIALEIALDPDTPWQSEPIAISGMPEAPSTGMGCTLLNCVEPGSKAWARIVTVFSKDRAPERSTAQAHFSGAFGSVKGIGGGAWGWVVYEADTHVWFMDENGNVTPMADAHRSNRPDVLAAISHISAAEKKAGFHIPLSDLEAQRKVAIRAISPQGTWTVSQTTASTLATDVPSAMKTLFSVQGTPSDLKKRANQFELPIALRLLQHGHAVQKLFTPVEGQIGEMPAEPKVSVIIPLYGRMDFVEHQLMEFSRDPYMVEHAEIIYAIDDPAIFEQLPLEAENLFNLYQMPFKWVWGLVNRGFSGANNLGASAANAPRLLFLNSDAFPTRPGWLEEMADTLDANPDYGMLAPRLLFADGSIQHAGMVNRYHAHLGVWINHHPLMGFDPAMDPCTDLTEMPLVTGACMLMQRDVFDQLGGWDTDYIIGDYEDSDLCFKTRDAGLKIGYLPSVELVHLERQSFKLFGEDGVRFRITLANAIRHQTRWQKFINPVSETSTS